MFTLLLAALLPLLAAAAPTMHAAKDTTMTYATGGGIAGFIIFILDVIVIIEVLKSTREPLPKLLWSLLVFLFPIGGILIYFIFSNRQAHKAGSGYEAIP